MDMTASVRPELADDRDADDSNARWPSHDATSP